MAASHKLPVTVQEIGCDVLKRGDVVARHIRSPQRRVCERFSSCTACTKIGPGIEQRGTSCRSEPQLDKTAVSDKGRQSHFPWLMTVTKKNPQLQPLRQSKRHGVATSVGVAQ